MNMKEVKLLKAIELRKSGQKEESNQILQKLADEYPTDAIIQYQCAWSFDVLGQEIAAVPFYEKAIALGLPEEDLQGAYIGLGSTYRTLGEYEKSHHTFLKGLQLFPRNRAIHVFHAMTLYNLERHEEAMKRLLTSLVETTNDEELKSYEKAIRFYSQQLNRIWS